MKPVIGKDVKLEYPFLIHNLLHRNPLIFTGPIAGDDINHIKTNGGRCFTIVGRGKNIKSANEKVYRYIDSIKIDGSWYRKDIGYKFFLSENKED